MRAINYLIVSTLILLLSVGSVFCQETSQERINQLFQEARIRIETSSPPKHLVFEKKKSDVWFGDLNDKQQENLINNLADSLSATRLSVVRRYHRRGKISEKDQSVLDNLNLRLLLGLTVFWEETSLVDYANRQIQGDSSLMLFYNPFPYQRFLTTKRYDGKVFACDGKKLVQITDENRYRYYSWYKPSPFGHQVNMLFALTPQTTLCQENIKWGNTNRINYVRKSTEIEQVILSDLKSMSECAFLKKYDLDEIISNRTYKVVRGCLFEISTNSPPSQKSIRKIETGDLISLSPDELSEIVFCLAV